MDTQTRNSRAEQTGKPRAGRSAGNAGGGRRGSPWLWLAVLVLANYLVISLFFPTGGRQAEVSYTFFREQVREGNVAEIYSQGDSVE